MYYWLLISFINISSRFITVLLLVLVLIIYLLSIISFYYNYFTVYWS